MHKAIKIPTKGRGGDGEGGGGAKRPLEILSRRDVPTYSHGYSWFLNPLYVTGMSVPDIADAWLKAEARRRPQFKQQIQDLEHGGAIDQKGRVEVELEALLDKAGVIRTCGSQRVLKSPSGGCTNNIRKRGAGIRHEAPLG